MNPQVYEVHITNPLSVNHIYATARTGRRFLTSTHVNEAGKTIEGGKQFAGYIKKIKAGDFFVPGRLHECFKLAGLPNFPPHTKIVVEAYATWPDNRARDLSNLEKPILDAMQKGGFILNDSYALWRSMDFKFEKGVHEVRLKIYVKDPQ